MQKYEKAFTLAEILITLTILGVVAALIIPNIMQRYQERATITKVKIAYELINNAITQAVILNGPLESWDIGNTAGSQDSAVKLTNLLEPNFQFIKKCNLNDGQCFSLFEEYKTFKGVQSWIVPSGKHNDEISTVQYILKNGIAIRFYSFGNNSCRQPNGQCFTVAIDINGNKKPNKTGIDYFAMVNVYSSNATSSYKIVPTKSACTYNDSSMYQGYGCAVWILHKNNMDYLRKDISSEYNKLIESL